MSKNSFWDNPTSKDKTPPANDGWKKSPGKKDTKKWCKGHVGREHALIYKATYDYKGNEYECHPAEESTQRFWYRQEFTWHCHHEQVCTTCGKILQWRVSAEFCPTRIARGFPLEKSSK